MAVTVKVVRDVCNPSLLSRTVSDHQWIFSGVSDYGCLLMHLAIFSIILLEVSDGPNECDQAALGSPHHFICYMWTP